LKFFFGSGRLCLDFLRTLRARSTDAIEGLSSVAEFVRWTREAGLPIEITREDLNAKDLDAAKLLREAIYVAIRTRMAGRAIPANVRTSLNTWAARQAPVPQILPDGKRISSHATDPFSCILAMIARDAIELLGSMQLERVRECADAECTSLFLDTSRPGNRRWCSVMPCANRNKVRAYRERQR
jgi:predicted RNA-binding Zn ribbon-like protein